MIAPASGPGGAVSHHSCPGGLDVHADEGGPVYVQGREAALKRFHDRYFEARDAQRGVTLSISTGDDGAP